MATGNNAGDAVLRGHVTRRAQRAPLSAPPVAHPPTPARMAATAAAQAARRIANLTVSCADAVAASCSLAELPEHLPDHALLAIIEGGIDRLGIIALSPGMIAALIEIQTLGRLSPAQPEARKPTRADAALAAEFIDGMLEGFDPQSPPPDSAVLTGFRYASHLADPRPLGLMLEDRGFQTLRLDLRLGPTGEREGMIFLAVPLPVALPRLAAPAGEDAAPKDAEVAPPAPAAPRKTLAGAVREAPIPLSAVLCRRRITLAELRALVPGAMLSLPRQSLSDARLEAANGHLLASGRLGEADGFHALRLQAPQTGRFPQSRRRDEPPIGDLTQPDEFRAPGNAEESLRHWHEALTAGHSAG